MIKTLDDDLRPCIQCSTMTFEPFLLNSFVHQTKYAKVIIYKHLLAVKIPE